MLYCYMQVLGITLKSLVFAFKKVHLIIDKEFIQAILISGRWLKKTRSSNCVLKFSLHKFFCKVCFILSYLFVLQMKKDQHFSGVLPPNPHQGCAMNPLWSLQHLQTPTCILQPSKTQSLFRKRH